MVLQVVVGGKVDRVGLFFVLVHLQKFIELGSSVVQLEQEEAKGTLACRSIPPIRSFGVGWRCWGELGKVSVVAENACHIYVGIKVPNALDLKQAARELFYAPP